MPELQDRLERFETLTAECELAVDMRQAIAAKIAATQAAA